MAENLYRKWRPTRFAELAGQEHVATTLRNALSGGRIAHAYLFAGPRGTGKTSAGRLLAKALNCRDRRDGEPCNQCDSCLSYRAGRAMDLIELDAASNRGIEEIRSLRDKVAFAPGAGDFKIYLIDEVHMLTEAAFNALLKTLEEPPPHAVFILATTEAHKVPPTIASRCQRFDFRRIPLSAAVATLERICEGEQIDCRPEALELIARTGTGSLRDSINLLDQLATSYAGSLTLDTVAAGLGLIGDERAGRLARLALNGELGPGLELIASVRDDGLDLRQFQRELVAELRAMLLVKSDVEPEGVTAERHAELAVAVVAASTSSLLRALQAFGQADLKLDPNSTLPLDIALAECALAGAPGAPRTEAQAGAPAPSAEPTPSRPTSSTAPVLPAADTAASAAPAPQAPAPEEASSAPPARTRSAPTEPEAPKPAPVTGNGIVALSALRDSMRLVYTKARGVSSQLGALLNSGCDIIKADEQEVVFGFRHPVHAENALKPANREALRAIVLDLTRMDVAVDCRHEQGVTDWKQRESATRSPLVRAAQEMGARVVSPAAEDDR